MLASLELGKGSQDETVQWDDFHVVRTHLKLSHASISPCKCRCS